MNFLHAVKLLGPFLPLASWLWTWPFSLKGTVSPWLLTQPDCNSIFPTNRIPTRNAGWSKYLIIIVLYSQKPFSRSHLPHTPIPIQSPFPRGNDGNHLSPINQISAATTFITATFYRGNHFIAATSLSLRRVNRVVTKWDSGTGVLVLNVTVGQDS